MKLRLSTGLLQMPHSTMDLKPFMRYKGLTESKFLPLLHDDAFHKLHDRFTILNNNQPLTDKTASSKKMKRQTKMISITRKKSMVLLKNWKSSIPLLIRLFSLTQKKRTYFCEYGYSNVREVILGEQKEPLRVRTGRSMNLITSSSGGRRRQLRDTKNSRQMVGSGPR